MPDDELLNRVETEGRAAWPNVIIARERLEEHLRRLADASDAPLEVAHPEELYLAIACAEGHEAAIGECDRTHVASVVGAIAKLATSAIPREEILQTVRAKIFLSNGAVLPRIAAYSGRGPLGAWIRVVATRVALDMRRERLEPPTLEDDALFHLEAPAGDPELEHLRTRYQGEFKRAFHEALLALEAEERSLLRMHLVDELTIDEIAPLFRIHRATAARRLERARGAIADKTRELLGERLALSASELTSLMALFLTKLDVSIARVLETGTP